MAAPWGKSSAVSFVHVSTSASGTCISSDIPLYMCPGVWTRENHSQQLLALFCKRVRHAMPTTYPTAPCACALGVAHGGTVCGTMRGMCGADASCLAINYQSLCTRGNHRRQASRLQTIQQPLVYEPWDFGRGVQGSGCTFYGLGCGL